MLIGVNFSVLDSLESKNFVFLSFCNFVQFLEKNRLSVFGFFAKNKAGFLNGHTSCRVQLWLPQAPTLCSSFIPTHIPVRRNRRTRRKTPYWPCKTWAAFPHMLKAGIIQFNLMNLIHRGGRRTILQHDQLCAFPYPGCY